MEDSVVLVGMEFTSGMGNIVGGYDLKLRSSTKADFWAKKVG